ncbi:hypothetical protein [Limobrevibacterium gyesilva]|uniref:Uncharacterized protein n=1 Tax=Limobrevibacterium gyesilva TaxID=2991712 RepID=A0AA41YRW6_9PROT|nr:hypothetical protein [Limobrevibacterium gyesilva]MCW3475463.1 hypothetical protein [Limobrevibacterium gyesilva]
MRDLTEAGIATARPRSIGDRLILIVLSALMVAYYGIILTDGHFNVLHPTSYGLTFNSMLEHLLRGQFDVDPAAVANEGFRRDGRVYSYWGILCALVRLPLLAWPEGLRTDVTGLSCLVAVSLAGYLKLRTLLFVYRQSPPSPDRALLVAAFGIWLLLAGAQTGYLRTSIYQEVLFWSAAITAGFVYCAVRGVLLGAFTTRRLACMAALAGLALLTRVSTGMGLYVALGLLLAVLAIADATRAGQPRAPAARLAATLSSRRILAPLGILLAGCAAAAAVNAQRWGNPLTFADFNLYLMNRFYPDRLIRSAEYGLFNVARIPFGLVYYFFPVWVVRRGDGLLLFEEHRTRLLDASELPPSSFLLTDLLPLILLVALCNLLPRANRARTISTRQTLAILAGLAIPTLLMLTAISMNYRYRMEFYPLLEFGGFIALYLLATKAAAHPLSRRLRAVLLAATAISLASTYFVLALYKLSPYGPGQMYLQNGVVQLYGDALREKLFH